MKFFKRSQSKNAYVTPKTEKIVMIGFAKAVRDPPDKNSVKRKTKNNDDDLNNHYIPIVRCFSRLNAIRIESSNLLGMLL